MSPAIKDKTDVAGKVYAALCLPTDKYYIGVTKKDLKERRYYHIRRALREEGVSAFHSAIRKYGEDNFVWNIISEYHNYDDALDAEQYFIKLYNTKSPDGYNMTDGGEGTLGAVLTAEHKQKICAGLKRFHLENPEASERARATMLQVYRDRPELRDIISKSVSGENHPNYGRRGADCPTYGRVHSDESRDKIRLAKQGKKNPMYGKSPDAAMRKIISDRVNEANKDPELSKFRSKVQLEAKERKRLRGRPYTPEEYAESRKEAKRRYNARKRKKRRLERIKEGVAKEVK